MKKHFSILLLMFIGSSIIATTPKYSKLRALVAEVFDGSSDKDVQDYVKKYKSKEHKPLKQLLLEAVDEGEDLTTEFAQILTDKQSTHLFAQAAKVMIKKQKDGDLEMLPMAIGAQMLFTPKGAIDSLETIIQATESTQ